MTCLRPHSQDKGLEFLIKCSSYQSCCLSVLRVVDKRFCQSAPQTLHQAPCPITSFLRMGQPALGPAFLHPHTHGLSLFSDLELYSTVSHSFRFFYFFFPKKFFQMLIFLVFVTDPLHGFLSTSCYMAPVCCGVVPWHTNPTNNTEGCSCSQWKHTRTV